MKLDGFDRVEKTVIALALATYFVMPPIIVHDVLLEIRSATAPQGTTDLSIVPRMKAAAAVASGFTAVTHLMAFDIFLRIRTALLPKLRVNLTTEGCPGTLHSTDRETCCEYRYARKVQGEYRYANQCCGSADGTVCVEIFKPRSSEILSPIEITR